MNTSGLRDPQQTTLLGGFIATGDEAPGAPSAPKSSRLGRYGRKKKGWLLGAAIVLVSLVSGLAGLRYGVQSENARWTPINARILSQAADYKNSAANLSVDLGQLKAQVASAVGDLNNPTFGLWTSCGAADRRCSLTPGSEYIGGVPDTFTYTVNFEATVPVTVWIMSTDNFVCWETKSCTWHGVGWQDRLSLSRGEFHDAEGCAGYIAVFFSKQAGTFTPDIHVTRNPATKPTGVCVSGAARVGSATAPAPVARPYNIFKPCSDPDANREKPGNSCDSTR